MGAFGDAAYDEGALVHAGKSEAGLFEEVGGDDGDEADAHVEGAHHFFAVEVAELLEMDEQWGRIPCRAVDVGAEAAGEDAREVFGESSAGDVGKAANDFGLQQFANGREVAAVRTHEGGADLVAELVDVLVGVVAGDVEEQALGDGVAVGVEAVGGQSEEDVAVGDVVAGDEAWARDDAGEEAGELVVVAAVEGGLLGGVAAEQGAAVGFAGVDEAGDDLLDDGGVEAAGGEVVHEVEGRGALDGDVVDAVIDEVGADGGVQAKLGSELQLGADAVSGGDEDGVGEAFGIELEEAGEAADFRQDIFVERAAGEALDAVVGLGAAGGGLELWRAVGRRCVVVWREPVGACPVCAQKTTALCTGLLGRPCRQV